MDGEINSPLYQIQPGKVPFYRRPKAVIWKSDFLREILLGKRGPEA